MGANFRFTCPVEGCDYTAGFRLSMGEEDLPEEQTKRLDILRGEHPNHPSASAGGRNVKPKDLHTEDLVSQDSELNF